MFVLHLLRGFGTDLGESYISGKLETGRNIITYNLNFSESPFLKDEAVDAIKVVKQEAHMFPEEVADFLHQLRKEAKKHPNGIDFSNPESLSDEGYYNLTGLHKEQFEDLYQTCKDFLGLDSKGKGKVFTCIDTSTHLALPGTGFNFK